MATEYFLRHLAQARNSVRTTARQDARLALAHSKALAEAIVLFVLMPSIALFCVAACIGARLPSSLGLPAHGLARLLVAFAAVCALVVLGHLWFSQRLRRFRDDPSPALRYDSPRDRRIVFWQKLIVTSFCGGAVPVSLLWLLAHS